MIMYEVVESKLSEGKLLDADLVVREIEEVISDFQLVISLKTTLSTMQGSTHYHLKQGRASGVLEVTYWPQENRLFVEIHGNRLSEWNKHIILPFSEALAQRFAGIVEPKASAVISPKKPPRPRRQ